jgi:hypothetical protein
VAVVVTQRPDWLPVSACASYALERGRHPALQRPPEGPVFAARAVCVAECMQLAHDWLPACSAAQVTHSPQRDVQLDRSECLDSPDCPHLLDAWHLKATGCRLAQELLFTSPERDQKPGCTASHGLCSSQSFKSISAVRWRKITSACSAARMCAPYRQVHLAAGRAPCAPRSSGAGCMARQPKTPDNFLSR